MLFEQTKFVAVLKPRMGYKLAEDFRPVALLSICYKVIERLILVRIKPILEEFMPVEYAGFSPKRSCCVQVLSLTTQ